MAEEVKALRGRYGVTQEELARVLGVRQPQVSARLNGKIPFTLDELDLLADYFGVTPGELLEGVKPGSPRPPTGGRSVTDQYLTAA